MRTALRSASSPSPMTESARCSARLKREDNSCRERRKRVEIASSGSEIDAGALAAQTGELQASSGSDISVSLRDEVRAEASSGADIDISGNPTRRDVDASSGGDIAFED